MSTTEKKDAVASEKEAQQQNVVYLRVYDLLVGLRKFWWLCVLFVLIGTGVMFYRSYVHFTPVYKTSVTLTVSTPTSDSSLTSYSYYYNKTTAQKLSDTFPYLLGCDLMHNLVYADLGVYGMPASVSASVVSGTNMFTITAVGTDALKTLDTLNSVIRNFPTVAEYVMGKIEFVILEEPVLPTAPSNSTSYSKAIATGALIGLAASAVLIAGYALIRRTVGSKSDIRQKLNQSCVGVLPAITFKKYRKMLNKSILICNPQIGTTYREAVRRLRNSVVGSLHENDKIILVSSAAPGEGKTTAASNFALSLVQLQKKVLLLDADIRNPSVGAIFSMEDIPQAEPGEVRYRIEQYADSKLDIFRFYRNRRSVYEIINAEYLKQLFDQLRSRYDYIVVDTPPAGMISDVQILAECADAVLFVVRQDTVRAERIRFALSSILETGARVIGCCLNGAETTGLGYGYGYGYGKYGYGKYRYGYGGRYGSYGYGYGERKKDKKKNEKNAT